MSQNLHAQEQEAQASGTAQITAQGWTLLFCKEKLFVLPAHSQHGEALTRCLGHFLLTPLEDEVVFSQRSPLCKTRSPALCFAPSHTLFCEASQEGPAQLCTNELSTRQVCTEQRNALPPYGLWSHNLLHPPLQGSKPRCILLSLEAVVTPQELLVLFVRTELNGSVWDHPHHGG